MNRTHFFCGAALALLAPLSAAHAQTVTVTDLNPSGYVYARALSVAGAVQVGGGRVPGGNGNNRAFLWKSSPVGVVDLQPPGYDDSFAQGVSGSTQVGYGYFTATQFYHALLWHGSAASRVDLNPAGLDISSAAATDGDTQVGYGAVIGHLARAYRWTGTAASAVDLTPAGADSAYAYGVSGNTEVGASEGLSSGDNFHAMLWTGTAATAVDLHPDGYGETYAYGVSGDTQVGAGWKADTGLYHPLLWRGSVQSVVDLSPAGFVEAYALAVSGSVQAGYGSTGNALHALLWKGTAASVVDLHAFLPAGFNMYSQAYGVDDGGSVVRVVGYGQGDGGTHAFLWQIAYGTQPVLTFLEPASRTAGRDAFTLAVHGANFTSKSAVHWNGAAQTTVFVSSTLLTAQIPASLIASAGTVSVTVTTPGAGASGERTLTIHPRPVLSFLSPASRNAGSGAFTLTVHGAGFLPRSLVKWKGAAQPTTFVSATVLTALIPASLVTHAGTAQVTVTTPQVATSARLPFTVSP